MHEILNRELSQLEHLNHTRITHLLQILAI
jgi:hypothetical protein